MIDIDGALLEGGGQILRIAAGLASIIETDVRVRNIRSKRAIPGLVEQPLCGIRLLAEISSGVLEGGYIGSTEIVLRPGKGQVESDFTTACAGSVFLVLQSALPVLIYSKHPTRLVLRGKTDEKSVPPIDFAKFIFLPFAKKHFGIDCDIQVHKRGVSSLGQGEIAVCVNPLALNPESLSLLDRGNIQSFTAVYWKSNHDHQKLAAILEGAIKKELDRLYPHAILRSIDSQPNVCDGRAFGVLLYATTSTGCILSASAMLDVPGESPALIREAAHKGVQVVRDLEEQLTHGGVVDMYLADQIVIFMALAVTEYVKPSNSCDHRSKHRRCEILVGKVSLHTITAMSVIERLLTDIAFSTEDKEGLGMVIVCERNGNPGRRGSENSSAAR